MKTAAKQLSGPGYEAAVRQTEDGFVVLIRELALAGSGKTLEAAWADLERRKAEYLEAMAAAGLSHEIPKPRAAARRSRLREDLLSFAAKCAVVGAVAGAVLIVGAGALANKAAQVNPAKLARLTLNRVSVELERITSAPADVQQKRLERVRRIGAALKPYREALEGKAAPRPR
jgi:hypothetical protein